MDYSPSGRLANVDGAAMLLDEEFRNLWLEWTGRSRQGTTGGNEESMRREQSSDAEASPGSGLNFGPGSMVPGATGARAGSGVTVSLDSFRSVRFPGLTYFRIESRFLQRR